MPKYGFELKNVFFFQILNCLFFVYLLYCKTQRYEQLLLWPGSCYSQLEVNLIVIVTVIVTLVVSVVLLKASVCQRQKNYNFVLLIFLSNKENFL